MPPLACIQQQTHAYIYNNMLSKGIYNNTYQSPASTRMRNGLPQYGHAMPLSGCCRLPPSEGVELTKNSAMSQPIASATRCNVDNLQLSLRSCLYNVLGVTPNNAATDATDILRSLHFCLILLNIFIYTYIVCKYIYIYAYMHTSLLIFVIC